MNRVRFVSFSLALGVLFCTGALPLAAQEESETLAVKSSGGIKGQIRGIDGKKKIGQASVIVVELNTNKEFRTQTEPNGKFQLTGLPHGYYDLAIETSEGLFVGSQVVNVPPAGWGIINLQLGPLRGEVATATIGDVQPAGLAAVSKRLNRREFWRSPKGIAIIAGVGGVALLAVASSDDEDPASRFAF